MSLEKAIKFGKEKRKEYRGSKQFDATCRNHAGCPACEENRLYKFKIHEPIIDIDEEEEQLLTRYQYAHIIN